MAGIDLIRQRLYDKYKKQGMSDEEALMRADRESQTPKSLEGENVATKDVITRLRKGGMSDTDIEESGIYKFATKSPKRKENNLKRLSRWIKMGVLGSRYKSDWQKRREQGGGALTE